MTDESDRQLPIACDLGAIDPERRPTYLPQVERLLRELPLAVEALPDGLASWTWPPSAVRCGYASPARTGRGRSSRQ